MIFKRLWSAKGLWLRILFCWALAATFPFFDEVKQYDLRFSLRGSQVSAQQIVLVHFSQEDWLSWNGRPNNLLRAVKETSALTDSFFWSSPTWNNLLSQILEQKPKGVGVTFYFNPQLPRPDESLRSLYDPRVIWAAQLDNEGRPLPPLMAGTYNHNLGLVDMREDEDHVLRRFTFPLSPIPHLAIKLAELTDSTGALQKYVQAHTGETELINFRGTRSVFPSISALSVLQGHVPPGFFKDKIVIVGSDSLQGYDTPMGHMARADALAQVVDNLINNRWIARLSPLGCAFYLLIILLLACFVLVSYPQMVAVVFLIWLGLGAGALSIWVFDTFYFWIPALSVFVLGLVSYVIFIGYQLSVKENQTWRLEQETRMLSAVDQLRNNFVSLISHDLKTPIAKIQAICDRLMAAPPEAQISEDVREGLGSVRKESMELHRYIQSILQISRLESNKVQLRKEATDLNEVVEKVISQVRPLSNDKRQILNTELEPMFSLEVDGVLIQEVILNLIENAVKYTPNDGQIVIKTKEVEDRVIFEVDDSGPGIPIGDRKHLFEKFFRGQAHQSQIKGTGLGLYLVKYFIELHGGEVFLESELGKGTRVGFTLPLDA